MTEQEQLKALAELDGWEYYKNPADNLHCVERKHRWFDTKCGCCFHECRADYLTSYDAIIPLIQKQDSIVQSLLYKRLNELFFWEYTPAQLCEALLRATKKWKE